jgi:hypothetical protein
LILLQIAESRLTANNFRTLLILLLLSALLCKKSSSFFAKILGLDEKIPTCHNRLLPLPNQCNKLVTWVQVELERETAIGRDAGQERRRKIAGCDIAASKG